MKKILTIILVWSTLLATVQATSDINNLPTTDYEGLKGSLMEAGKSSSALAENAQWLREGIYTPLTAMMPQGGGKALSRPDAPAASVAIMTRVQVYPNPFTTELTFDLGALSETIHYEINVTDLFGKLVWHTTTQGGMSLLWNAGHAPSGTYFYSIYSDSEVVASGKIVKFSK